MSPEFKVYHKDETRIIKRFLLSLERLGQKESG